MAEQQYPVQRRFQRYALSVRIEVERPGLPTGPVPGLTMEISEGGFSSMLARALEIGEQVIARFALPPSGRLSFHAVARNKDLFRYGFEFVSLSDELRQHIIEACRSLPVYEGGWR